MTISNLRAEHIISALDSPTLGNWNTVESNDIFSQVLAAVQAINEDRPMTTATAAPTRRRGQQASQPASDAASMQVLADAATPATPAAQPAPAELTVDQQIDQQIQGMMEGGGRRNVNAQINMQEVRLYPYHVEMEINGIRKAISLMDFKILLDQQLQIDTKLEAMAMPTYTYLFARSANTMQIGIYYPERKMDLKYQPRGVTKATVYKGCIMPNVIITHTLGLDNNVWVVRDSKYIATNLKPTQLPENQFVTEISGQGKWRMPFPNFYEDGRMCFGHNTMPVKYSNNLRGLEFFYKIIEEAPFNNDLGLNVPDYRDNIPGWFEHLATLDKFPYEKIRSRGY